MPPAWAIAEAEKARKRAEAAQEAVSQRAAEQAARGAAERERLARERQRLEDEVAAEARKREANKAAIAAQERALAIQRVHDTERRRPEVAPDLPAAATLPLDWDLITLVLAALPATDLANAASVCRTFSALLARAAELRAAVLSVQPCSASKAKRDAGRRWTLGEDGSWANARQRHSRCEQTRV